MELITILKISHLVGLMAGLGGALYTDYLMITRGILKKIDKETTRQITHLSHVVIVGLAVLWLSGSILAYLIYLENPRFITNEKFWAKVTIVLALTLNGFFIHSIVLRTARENVGKRLLFDTPFRMTVVLTIAGCVSFTSWFIPFILGSTPEFSYVIPYETIMLAWIIAILSATASIFVIIILEEFWREFSEKKPKLPELAS